MATETINAWAAGIVDGEGYIKRRKNRKGSKTQPYVRVDNTDLRILQKLAKNYEGSILFNIRKNRPNSKPCWYWHLCNRKCIRFLLEIESYLVSKREIAQKTIIG